MPSDQWARVPLTLLTSASPNAVVLYGVIAARAHRERHTARLSNARLCDETGWSLSTLHRAKRELLAEGWIEHDGEQGREHVPTYTVHLNRVTSDTPSAVKGVTSDITRVSPVTHRKTEVVTTSEVDLHTLRVCHDESEQPMRAAPDEPMFEVEVPVRETPIGSACLQAFLDAYGSQPVSPNMIGRLGKRFVTLAATYSRDELLAVAADLGRRRIVAENAVEPFLLRARQPAEQSKAGWSALAAATLPDPFAQQA